MPSSPKLRVFGVVNHVSHQYSLLKLAKEYPIKFSYLSNNVRRWSKFSARPEPTTWLSDDEFEWVTTYEPGKYDVAILHTDQQHVDPNIGKGKLYRELNQTIQDIPKIVIQHGSPMWDSHYPEDIVINGGTIHNTKGAVQLDGMKQLIGDNFMVVNSYDSVKRWGWGYPIIHGLEADEWYDLPKEPRVVISLSPGGLDHYYNRQLLSQVKAHVKEQTGLTVQHVMVNYEARTTEEFKEYIGTSLVYVNPTKDSPMPRSRSEAMLSGCCVLTSRYHNADEFINHGVNGFIVPDNPLSYAEAIKHLINDNYQETVEIGQRGKETAKKLFDPKRFRADWWDLLQEIHKGNRPKWDGKKIW